MILTSPFDAFAALRARGRACPTASSAGSTPPTRIDNAWARLERSELGSRRLRGAVRARGAAQLGGDVAGRAGAGAAGRRDPARRWSRRCAAAARPGCARPASPTTWPAATRGRCDRAARAGARSWPSSTSWWSRARSASASRSRGSTRSPASCSASSPPDCVFLDDLGINLKPARAMGMTTIKVGEPGPALAELAALVGLVAGVNRARAAAVVCGPCTPRPEPAGERPPQRPRRRAGELLALTAHRLLPHGMLRDRARGPRGPHRLHAGDGGVPRPSRRRAATTCPRRCRPTASRGSCPGDRWCLCASRWLEAWEAGVAPPVFLAGTHEATLAVMPLELLLDHALDAPTH